MISRYLVQVHSNYKGKSTLRISGAMELGPLDEKKATFADTGLPTCVFEWPNFTVGDLFLINFENHDRTKDIKESRRVTMNSTLWIECSRVFWCRFHSQLQCMGSHPCIQSRHHLDF